MRNLIPDDLVTAAIVVTHAAGDGRVSYRLNSPFMCHIAIIHVWAWPLASLECRVISGIFDGAVLLVNGTSPAAVAGTMSSREHRPARDSSRPAASRRDQAVAPGRVAPGKRTLTMGLASRNPAGAPPLQRKPEGSAAAPGPTQGDPVEDWMRVALRPDLHQTPILRKSAREIGYAETSPQGAPPSTIGTTGRPLPTAVQAKMEDAYASDFSAVRVHEGEHVTAMGALAYTQGSDIHFAPGQYDPGSQRGQELLGHELTHVVQQAQGRVSAGTQASGMPVNTDASLEREADVMGARAARGERAGLPAGPAARSSAVVQRVAPEEIHNLVNPQLGTPQAVIALFDAWLQLGYRTPLAVLDRNQTASLWMPFHRWFQKNVPTPYSGGMTVQQVGPGVVRAVPAVPSDAMDVEPSVAQHSTQDEDIARHLQGRITRSQNGTQGVFFAGPYAIKPDDGETYHAIALGEALGVPQPVPARHVTGSDPLAGLIRERLAAELGGRIAQTTGFVVMRKIAGVDFSELGNDDRERLHQPKVLADMGKLWAFLGLLGSTDDFGGGNTSNLMLEKGEPPALIGVDVQLDDIVEPEEAGGWIERLADELEDRGLPSSRVGALQGEMEGLGMSKRPATEILPSFLEGIVSMLEAGLRAAHDADARTRAGERGAEVLDAIAGKAKDIQRIRAVLERL